MVVASSLTIQLVVLFLCQVQGGIITNQESFSLPKELADSIAVASNTANETVKNGTRTGRVIYTASYSNVRISSKEPKSLKYFPIPAVISKKHKPSPTVIVPVLMTSEHTEAPMASSSTTEAISSTTPTTTSTTATTTTTTTTTTTPAPTPGPGEVEARIPDIIEILEEIEPSKEDDEGEVVTEMVSGDLDNSDDNGNAAVTEQMVGEE